MNYFEIAYINMHVFNYLKCTSTLSLDKWWMLMEIVWVWTIH